MLSTIISGIIFIQINHPLAIGLILLIQTALTCLITGIIRKTFWFSYILFLIFLGGILVLFIYVTALASNEIFSISINILITYSALAFIIITLIIIRETFLIQPITERIESSTIRNIKLFYQENSIRLIKLYNYPTNYTTIILIRYLLVTLIAVVKITNVFHGPLRKIN